MNVKFDYARFAHRTNLKQREVAKNADVSTGLVGNWAIGKAVPSYEKILKLIEIGMTAHELFGDELGDKLVKNSAKISNLDKNEVKAAVLEALADISKSK